MPDKRNIRLDSTDAQVKKLKVGDTVEATIRGKVTALEASREMFDGEDRWPAEINVDVSSMKVSKAQPKNAFTRMAEEDMEDT